MSQTSGLILRQILLNIYLYIYNYILIYLRTEINKWIYIYEVHTIGFQTFYVRAFQIFVDSWKFSMLLLYTLWDDALIFMISGSKEKL